MLLSHNAFLSIALYFSVLLIFACSSASEQTAAQAVTSAEQSTAIVPAGYVNQTTQITVQARDASGSLRRQGGDSVKVVITGMNPQELTINNGIVDNANGEYIATYTPTQIGPDQIAITIGDTAIQGSPFTSTVSAEPPPLFAPILEDLTPAGNGAIQVNWASVPDALGYFIYYSSSDDVTGSSTRVDAGDVTQFTVTGLSNNQVFYFRVGAYGINNTLGPLSNNTLSSFTYLPFNARWANPRPSGHSIYDIQWLNGQYLAVGGQGTILTSADGTTWATQVSGLKGGGAGFRSVAWSGSRYIVVGWNNSISLSTDSSGTDWIPIVDLPRDIGGPGAYHFDRVIWDGFRFVMLSGGQHMVFFINEDGSNFQHRSLVKQNSDILQDFTWDALNNRYLACGGFVHTSTDGITWEDFPEFTARFPCERIKMINGAITILGGNAIVSSDSNPPWSVVNLPAGGAVDFAFVNGHYAAVTSSSFFYSDNFTSWNSLGINSAVNRITTIAGGPNGQFNGEFIMAGYYGQMARANASVQSPLLESTSPLLAATEFSAIASNGTVHVAMGKENIMFSPDNGVSWSIVNNTGLDAAIVASTFNDVEWINGQFIAVGSGGVIATSGNGQNWTLRQNGGSTLNSVTWNGNATNPIYVAVGVGDIYRSTDAISWNPESSNSTEILNEVIWADDGFLAVGYQRNIVTSTGNGAWTQGVISELNVDTDIMNIVDNGQTMIIRTRTPAASYYSTDRGVSWTQGFRFSGKIVWDGSLFVSPNGGNLFLSPDGIHGEFVLLDAVTSSKDICVAGNRLYLSGSYGHIVEVSR